MRMGMKRVIEVRMEMRMWKRKRGYKNRWRRPE